MTYPEAHDFWWGPGGKIRKELIPNIHTTAFLATGYFKLFTVKVDNKSVLITHSLKLTSCGIKQFIPIWSHIFQGGGV